MSGCDNHIDNHSRERDLEFSISRATWSSVDLSNDGKSIVISALGDIYEVPIDGGIATAILTDKHINIQPRYSHDGENILFASNRSGVFLGWKISRSSGEIARLTTNSESEQFTIAESNNGDQGSQFTSQAFTGLLKEPGIKISMDGKGAWRDNVFVERLWRSVKYEEVYLHAYDTVSEARTGIGKYFDVYNRRRPHSSLEGNTPDQVYYSSQPLTLAA